MANAVRERIGLSKEQLSSIYEKVAVHLDQHTRRAQAVLAWLLLADLAVCRERITG